MFKSRDISRRTALLGITSALAAAMLPRSARAGGHRVLVIGGSTMRGALGKFVEDELAALGHVTHREAKSSSGLARPDFHDWIEHGGEYAQDFSPTATVIMFGGNDAQGLYMGDDADPQWIRWDEEGWSAEYRRRCDALAEAVAPAGEHVVWLGLPEMRSSKLDRRTQHMNTIFEAAMAARTHGHYLPTRGRLTGAAARYVDVVKQGGKSVKIRAGDGVHFSTAGAKLLAADLAPDIDGLLS